jgi:SAM-dependent methyltransferase
MAAVLSSSGSAELSLGESTAMLGGAGWTQLEPGARGAAKLSRWLRRLAARSSTACRVRRGRLFVERLQPTEDDRILDLGGGSGGHIAELVPYRCNVTIGELDAKALRHAAETYGFSGLQLDGGETFPVADGEYDVVLCSSVIEHVTGPKEIAYQLRTASNSPPRRARRRPISPLRSGASQSAISSRRRTNISRSSSTASCRLSSCCCRGAGRCG